MIDITYISDTLACKATGMSNSQETCIGAA